MSIATHPSGDLTGLPVLARLAARRNRLFYGLWVWALGLTMIVTPAAYEKVAMPGVGTDAAMAALGGNPTMRAMLGPPFQLANAAGFTMWRVGTFVATALAFMAAFGVIRATRAEEEVGRLELLLSGAIGRRAPLAAAVLVAAVPSVLVGLLSTLALGRATGPWTSAIAGGLGITLTGLVGAGLGAVAAQLTESARAARGIVAGTLGAAYLLRAVADGSAQQSTLASLGWASPLQWAAYVRPYADERWWVLALPALLTLGLLATAVRLHASRDHGGGIRPTPTGPGAASPSLRGATGLAWRLHRPSMLGWAVGIVLFAVAMGSLSDAFETAMQDLPQLGEILRRMGGGAQAMRDAFYVAMLGILAVVLTLFGLSMLARLRQEEERGHAEMLLSTATPRRTFAMSHLGPALLVPTVLLVLGGALLGLSEALAAGSGEPVWRTATAALVRALGVWLCVGLGMLLHGWAPRLFGIVWGVVGWTLFAQWIGAVIGLPEWVTRATPFAVLPQVPVEPMVWTPVLLATVVAAALSVGGLAGYSRRDVG